MGYEYLGKNVTAYIKEYEDLQIPVEYVFMDALPGNIDKDRLIQWSNDCDIALEFTNFDDTLS